MTQNPESQLDFPISCDMQHPPQPGHQATPCTRPAAYIATVHDCRKRHRHPAGSTVPICNWFLDELRQTSYPTRCPGCNQEHTSILMAVWDIQKLTPPA